MSRRKRGQFIPRRVRELECVINFILERHAVGLLVLLGEEDWPDVEELAAMVTAEHSRDEYVRVQGGQKIPEAQSIIESTDRIERAVKNAGGLERIREVFRELKATDQQSWSILRDSSAVRRGRPHLTADYTARMIARRHYMHEDTLRRNRMIIIQRLAFEICYPGLDYMRRGQGMAV